MKINIMIVEDNAAIRAGYKECMIDEAKNHGMQAIVDDFSNSDNAIKRLLDTKKPVFDLLFTDIDLAGSPNPNRAGINFARYAKKTLPDVPIIGCSGFFADTDLAEEEKQHFDAWWPKGSTFRNLESMFNDAIERAIIYKKNKINEGENLTIQTPETEEQFLSEGYKKQEIILENYAKHLDVWVKETKEGCEIEVIGCPSLLAWGDDYSQAVEVLVELIDEYKFLLDEPDERLSPSMWQARALVRSIVYTPAK